MTIDTDKIRSPKKRKSTFTGPNGLLYMMKENGTVELIPGQEGIDATDMTELQGKETKKGFFQRKLKELKELKDKEDKAGSFAKQKFIADSNKKSDLKADFVAKGSPHKDNIKLAAKGGEVKGYMGGGEVHMDDSPNSGLITTKGWGKSRAT